MKTVIAKSNWHQFESDSFNLKTPTHLYASFLSRTFQLENGCEGFWPTPPHRVQGLGHSEVQDDFAGRRQWLPSAAPPSPAPSALVHSCTPRRQCRPSAAQPPLFSPSFMHKHMHQYIKAPSYWLQLYELHSMCRIYIFHRMCSPATLNIINVCERLLTTLYFVPRCGRRWRSRLACPSVPPQT